MSTPAPSSAAASRTRWAGVVALLLVAMMVAAALYAGTRLAESSGTATAADDSSVDAGFARDMQRHHSQAVQMSLSLLNTSRDAEVRTLASDILLTQQQQAGQMYAWLQTWGLTQTSNAEPMEWMTSSGGGTSHDMEHMDDSSGSDTSHDLGGMGDSTMPGMASPAQLQALDVASPGEIDRLYLELMIPHHRGALDMAQYAADSADNEVVRRLAGSIVSGQTSELDVLRQMLDERS